MAELLERVKLSLLVNGLDIADNFKKNSLYFFNKYKSSDIEVMSLPVGKLQMGGFYHFHYMDDSNWMKYSPVFTVDFKKFEDMIVVIAINFNFIPIEVRVSIFDKYIAEEDFEKDKLLRVDYKGVYNELLKYGFEYALVEYNLKQIVNVHKINLSILPRFLYSADPINKYDPKKLYEIWKAKLNDKKERDAEMKSAMISDFFDVSNDIMDNYKQLKGHIDRLKKSLNKYG